MNHPNSRIIIALDIFLKRLKKYSRICKSFFMFIQAGKTTTEPILSALFKSQQGRRLCNWKALTSSEHHYSWPLFQSVYQEQRKQKLLTDEPKYENLSHLKRVFGIFQKNFSLHHLNKKWTFTIHVQRSFLYAKRKTYTDEMDMWMKGKEWRRKNYRNRSKKKSMSTWNIEEKLDRK